MNKITLALVGAVLLALPACNGDQNAGWTPTPGAPITVGSYVTPADPPPPPFLVSCDSTRNGPVSLDGKLIYKVTAVTEDTATINADVLPGDAITVDLRCLVPYVRK